MPVPTPRNAAMAQMMMESLSGLLQGLAVKMYVFCMEGWMRNARGPNGEPIDEEPIEVVLITGQSATEETTVAFPMLRDADGVFTGLSDDNQRMKPSRSELGAWGRLLRTSAPATVH